MTYRRRDSYYKRARAEGYRARSVYKLDELDRRYKILRRGDAVVDLGAWPGGWLQLALKRVGPGGRVVGVDLATVERLAAPNLSLLQADVRDPAIAPLLLERLGRPADVVLSDLAPKLTGIRATDEARTEELVDAALALIHHVLGPGGRFVMKTFMGPHHATTVAAIRERFADVHTTRPDATRRGSSELYFVAAGFSICISAT